MKESTTWQWCQWIQIDMGETSQALTVLYRKSSWNLFGNLTSEQFAASFLLCLSNYKIRIKQEHFHLKFLLINTLLLSLWEFHACVWCIFIIFTTTSSPNSSQIHPSHPHPLPISYPSFFLTSYWIQFVLPIYLWACGHPLAWQPTRGGIFKENGLSLHEQPSIVQSSLAMGKDRSWAPPTPRCIVDWLGLVQTTTVPSS